MGLYTTHTMLQDLKQLENQGGPSIPATRHKNGKLIMDLSINGALAALTKQQTSLLLTHVSTCEHRPTHFGPANEAKFACDYPGCDSKFVTNHRLQTHRVRTHGYRDMYRKLVVDECCPMCRGKFASKVGAMNHIQKVCGKKGTEEERAKKVRRILLDRQVANGEVGAINASLMRGAQ